ncbi:MAG: serine--tRNA ligase [Patescibacteria group bacterium]|jgi:seryl-tRNA synthetase
MIDIKLLRKNTDFFRQAFKKRNVKDVAITEIIEHDKQYRENLQKIEELKNQKNSFNKNISKFTKEEKVEKIQQLTDLTAQEAKLEEEIKNIKSALQKLTLDLPNLPAEDVNVGKDESENKVIKKIGNLPKFSFKPKSYLEIAENLDIIDTKRAAKVSGPRFGYLKKEGALLWNALIQYTLEILLKENFIPFYSPSLVKEEVMHNSGYNSYTEGQEAYFISKDKLYLVGTGEHALLPYHSDEILKSSELPLRYTTFSSCFRREAGSYGKDTKGILRVHQFDKQEMVVISAPQNSWEIFEELLGIQKTIIEGLGLPYQLLMVCTGDLPKPSAKVIDLECWMPSENKYRETHSASNCTDFQARRNNIKYRDKENILYFPHILNATAITPRTLLSIIENCQQEDSSVKVPEKLHKFCNFTEIRKK